jgi:hypothetical protein
VNVSTFMCSPSDDSWQDAFTATQTSDATPAVDAVEQQTEHWLPTAVVSDDQSDVRCAVGGPVWAADVCPGHNIGQTPTSGYEVIAVLELRCNSRSRTCSLCLSVSLPLCLLCLSVSLSLCLALSLSVSLSHCLSVSSVSLSPLSLEF